MPTSPTPLPPLAPEEHDRDYPIQEDMRLQRKVWRFERVGWYALLLIILLTLLGGFSKGPLSDRQARSEDGRLSVNYQGLARNGGGSTLVVHVQGRPGEPLELTLRGELLEGFSIDSLQPQPLASTSGKDSLVFKLGTDPQGYAVLYLGLRADGVGRFRSELQLAGGAPLSLTQFIYP